MASITKLMTALVALDHASLDDVATISRRTASVGESTINLRPGEHVTLRDLIRARSCRARTTQRMRSPRSSAAARWTGSSS